MSLFWFNVGKISKIFQIPGGGAQGTNIGILNFLVYVNSCGVPFDKMMDCLEHEHKEQYLGLPVQKNEEPPIKTLGWTKICHPVLPLPNTFISENEAMFKYIDDMTAAEAIKTAELIPISEEMERPLNFRDRTLHQLPSKSGPLQNVLLEIDKFCDIQQMKINSSKSKTAVFNAATSRDFYPRLVNAEGKIYENVEKFTLLGVEFESHQRSGVKWDSYIAKCTKKAYSNMWILRRLAEMGVSTDDLKITYEYCIKTHFESNVPLWHFSISQKLSHLIEKVQKACMFIILGKNASYSYSYNLATLNLEPLSDRRNKLCQNYAKKSRKNPSQRSMFTWNEGRQTRDARKVLVPYARTSRYERSSFPSLARIINSL